MTAERSLRLERLRANLDALAEESLRLWLLHGRDPSGGAYGHLDRAFRPVFDDPARPLGPSGEVRGSKGLVQQARHLYAYSLYQERRPGWASCEAAAHAQYDHLLGVFGRSGRPFVHQVDRHHAVVDERAQLYAQSFAVFGLAQYARTFSDAEAALRARELFGLVDALRHDLVFGGYDQREDGGWLTEVGAPLGAAKCTNTHLHVLEAMTALLRAQLHVVGRADELVTGRLRELGELLVGRLLRPAGYVHGHFELDWTPVGDPEVSYGHDWETSWLLLEAFEALAVANAVDAADHSLAASAARRMAEHALRTGWDPAGGPFERGIPEGHEGGPAVTSSEKVWWAQAEALPGLYRLYRSTGNEELLAALEATARFITRISWDPLHGEFFWGVDSRGRVGPRGEHKGELWKAPYHTVRAFLLTADWIAEDLRGMKTGP